MILSRVFPGRLEDVREVRQWVREQLPPCAARDDVEMIASELAANAVLHTASGQPGGVVAAWLAWWPDRVRVVIGDGGAATVPVLVAASAGEGQRCLALVDALAATWAHAGGGDGRWVRADVTWDGLPPAKLAATPARQCSCGFAELADETLTDHLLAVFVPRDSRGPDGRLHEERERGQCRCGLAAPVPGALDDHFLLVFTPIGAIGRDGARQ